MSMCEKKLQSILKLFDYPRGCRGEIVSNTLLPETSELGYCFCDQSSTEALKWALEHFLNSVTDCGDKKMVPYNDVSLVFSKKDQTHTNDVTEFICKTKVTSLQVLNRSF